MHALFVLSGWTVSTLVATVHSGFVRRCREADRTLAALCPTPGATVDPLTGMGLPGFRPVRRGEVREPVVLATGALVVVAASWTTDVRSRNVFSGFVRLLGGEERGRSARAESALLTVSLLTGNVASAFVV